MLFRLATGQLILLQFAYDKRYAMKLSENIDWNGEIIALLESQ